MAAALRLNILELMARLALVYLVFSEKIQENEGQSKTGKSGTLRL